jgi:hypothetical protein
LVLACNGDAVTMVDGFAFEAVSSFCNHNVFDLLYLHMNQRHTMNCPATAIEVALYHRCIDTFVEEAKQYHKENYALVSYCSCLLSVGTVQSTFLACVDVRLAMPAAR